MKKNGEIIKIIIIVIKIRIIIIIINIIIGIKGAVNGIKTKAPTSNTAIIRIVPVRALPENGIRINRKTSPKRVMFKEIWQL